MIRTFRNINGIVSIFSEGREVQRWERTEEGVKLAKGCEYEDMDRDILQMSVIVKQIFNEDRREGQIGVS